MNKFFYTVKDQENKIITGYINASSVADAALMLEQKGFIVLEIKEHIQKRDYSSADIPASSPKLVLSLKEKRSFFNSFYVLYKSGLSINDIFQSIMNSSNNPNVRRLCSIIVKKTRQGKSLKETLKCCSEALGFAYSMLIIAGEESGKLEENLSGIINNLKKQEQVKNGLIGSMAYPVIVFIMAIAVGLFFKFFVLKIFASMADGVCSSYILTTAITAIIKILLIFFIAFLLIYFVYKNKRLLNKIVGFLMDLKLFGNIVKYYSFSNFFHVLALAYESGVSLTESVMLAGSVIKIKKINVKLKKAENMMQKGCSLTTALASTGIFNEYTMSQISSGESAGELEKTLKIAAIEYENNLDMAIKIMLKLVEPIMLVLVGIMVANIAINAYKSYFSSLFSMF